MLFFSPFSIPSSYWQLALKEVKEWNEFALLFLRKIDVYKAGFEKRACAGGREIVFLAWFPTMIRVPCVCAVCAQAAPKHLWKLFWFPFFRARCMSERPPCVCVCGWWKRWCLLHSLRFRGDEIRKQTGAVLDHRNTRRMSCVVRQMVPALLIELFDRRLNECNIIPFFEQVSERWKTGRVNRTIEDCWNGVLPTANDGCVRDAVARNSKVNRCTK